MSHEPGGEEASLHALERMSRGVELIAGRTLGDPDDVQDAVQETLARAVETVRGGRVPAGVPLTAFVHGIARHVIADALRRRIRERGADRNPGRLASREPSPLQRLVSFEERESVRRAVAQLAAADRELLRLCFVEGERLVEMAKRSGEPPDRVRKRKSRALDRLRAILAGSAGGHVSPRPPTSCI